MTIPKELTTISFNLIGNEYCCGIYNLGEFSFAQDNHYTKQTSILKPASEVLEKFDSRLLEDLWEEVSQNENSNDEGYYYVNCSIVPSTPSLEALLQHMKDKRWKVISEFKNHNTKNAITVLGKKFKYSALKRKFHKKEDEDDWNW